MYVSFWSWRSVCSVATAIYGFTNTTQASPTLSILDLQSLRSSGAVLTVTLIGNAVAHPLLPPTLHRSIGVQAFNPSLNSLQHNLTDHKAEQAHYKSGK